MRRIGSFLPIAGLSIVLLGLLGCTQLLLLFDQAPTASFAVSSSTTTVGSQITLDGSSSSDPQSYALAYAWSLSGPTGSKAALSATDQAKVTFTPDTAGDYVVSLRVTEQSAGHKYSTKSKTITVASGSSVQPPTDLVATASTTAVAVDLSWTASATPGATYTIYRGTSSAGESPTPLVTGLQTTSYEDTAVQAGTTYYYIVLATAGTGSGASSSEVYATPTTPTATVQPPTNLAAASSATAVAVDLSWTASATPGATYTVYRGLSSGVGAQTAIKSGITGTTYEDATVQAGTTYYYTVTATVNGIESTATSGVYAVPNTPTVQAPTSLTATASTTSASITLDWTASATSTATYDIYRGAASGAELTTPIATGVSGTSYGDDTVAPNTQYFYQVSAVEGGTESTPTAEASATSAAIVAPPAGLLATVNAPATAVDLTWTASPTPGVVYNVYRTATPGTSTPPTEIAPSVSGTTYSDSSATPGTEYYYSVTATTGGIESTATNMAEANVLTQPPTGLVAVASASSVSVDLSWTPSVTSGVTYKVYRSTSASLDGNLSSTTPIRTSLTATTYTDSDTTLTPGTTYYYVVTAVGTNGDESNPSNQVQTITSSTGSGSGSVSVTVN